MRLIIIFCLACVCRGEEYFSGVSFHKEVELHQLLYKWYSGHLRALEELPLSPKKDTVARYRFTWLRSSDRPVALRIDVMEDGSAIFVLKVADGKGGYEPGKVVRNENWKLDPQKLKAFKAIFDRAAFFEQPVAEDAAGVDGSRWLIEANLNGRYHIVSRWTPRTGAIRDIGLNLINMATADFSPIY